MCLAPDPPKLNTTPPPPAEAPAPLALPDGQQDPSIGLSGLRVATRSALSNRAPTRKGTPAAGTAGSGAPPSGTAGSGMGSAAPSSTPASSVSTGLRLSGRRQPL